jgi:hypothetical protein
VEAIMNRILQLNEHSVDRAVRVVAGLMLLSLVWFGPKSLWGLVGAVPLVTGLVGTCPLYTLLGFSTCKVRGHA